MKKIFTLVAAALMAVGAQAQVEKYEAVTYDGAAYTASADFANAVIADGKSVVKFGTANMEVEAVGGTTPKDVETGNPGGEFPGWQEWNDVKWDVKNQGDITFGYILGTGNPVVELNAEEVTTDGEPTGRWRASYVYYGPVEDATHKATLPLQGLYYKFTAKAAGELKLYVWSNKGNRNTYLVDDATAQPVAYKAEGYINGQNDADGKKKWLTSEEIQAIHDAAKLQDLDGDGVKETDSAPYCIGAGNQAFWGSVVYTMAANQTVWLFQDSSQIGFQKYEFTADASAINNISVAPVKAVTKAIQNGRVVIMKGDNTFNVAGQLVK